MSTTIEIELPGISCINCVQPIEQSIEARKAQLNVERFVIDVTTKKLYVTFKELNKNSTTALTKVIDDCGIDWHISSPRKQTDLSPKAINLKDIVLSHWSMAILGLLSGIGFLTLSLSAISLSFAATIALTAIGVAITAIIGAPSFYQAWMKMKLDYTLTMDSLFSLSAVVVTGLSIAALFIPGLPVMIEAALLVFGFRHLGQGIEHSLIKKATGSTRFQDRLPSIVHKCRDNRVAPVALHSIEVDDIIELSPGDLIPFDGILVSSKGCILDTIKSGSAVARNVHKGEALLSGFKVAPQSSAIRVRITKRLNECYLATMDKQLIEMQHHKAPVQRFADTLLQYFIPSIIGLAVVSGLGVAFFFPAALAIKCAAAVLVSACPCTLGLIVPLGVKVGVKKALEHGVEFTNATALEKASTIDCVVFDLNGSLTKGKPQVVQFNHYVSNHSAGFCHNLTKLLEQDTAHPIGRALFTFAQQHPKPKPLSLLSNLTAISGGRSATFSIGHSHQKVSIGNAFCMEQLGVTLPKVPSALRPGEQRIYLAQEGRILCSYDIYDPLREHALTTVQTLKKLGMDIHICTGADNITTQSYARLLNIPIENIATSCVPVSERNKNTKTAYIQLLQKQGKKVAMVGDAGNDSLALVQSDFGIAMLSASSDDMTQNSAAVRINRSSCLPILHCFTLAKQSLTNIHQNLSFSLLYNSGVLLLSSGLLLGLGLSLNPAIGAGLMVLQTACILLNVFRFSQQKVAYSNTERSHKDKRLNTSPSLGVRYAPSKNYEVCASAVLFQPADPPLKATVSSPTPSLSCSTKYDIAT